MNKSWFQGGIAHVSLTLGLRKKRELLPPSGQKTIDVKTLLISPKALREFEKATKESKDQEFGKALEHFRKAIRLHPQFFQAYNNLGGIYLRMGNLSEAETAFSKAIEINPSSAAAQKNLGYLYLMTNRAQEAIEPLSKASLLNPTDVDTDGFLGEALYQVGRYTEAEAPLKKVLQIDPNRFGISYRLGYLYLKLDRYTEALKAFQHFLKTNKGPEPRDVKQLVRKLEKIVQ
ncbi:tetratricopeptide repeat protein [Acidobacteria bacterium AH-259-A15]|nr:tetratricopeptide repeat protein [Acidobacteria bacterium AH-259-A15]